MHFGPKCIGSAIRAVWRASTLALLAAVVGCSTAQQADTEIARAEPPAPPAPPAGEEPPAAPQNPGMAPSLPSAAEAAFAWTGAAADESGELEAVLGLLWKNAALAANKKGEVEVDVSTATYRRSGRLIFRTRTKAKKESKEETEHTLKVRAGLSERPTQAEVDKLLKICIGAPKDELDVGAGVLAAASVATSCEVAEAPSGWGLGEPSRTIRVRKWDLVTKVGPDGVKVPPPCRLGDWTLERWEADGAKGIDVLWEISAKGSRAHAVESFAECTSKLQDARQGKRPTHGSKTSWAFGAKAP